MKKGCRKIISHLYISYTQEVAALYPEGAVAVVVGIADSGEPWIGGRCPGVDALGGIVRPGPFGDSIGIAVVHQLLCLERSGGQQVDSGAGRPLEESAQVKACIVDIGSEGIGQLRKGGFANRRYIRLIHFPVAVEVFIFYIS